MINKYDSWAIECDRKRRELGMTWSDVAKAVGYSRPHISAIMNRKRKSEETRKALCNFFEVTI